MVTKHETSHQVQKKTVKGTDGSVMQEESTETTVKYVDAEGNFTKALIHFTEWSRRSPSPSGSPGNRTAPR